MQIRRQTGLACALALLGMNTTIAAPQLTVELDHANLRAGEAAILKVICFGGTPKTVQQERLTPGIALEFIKESTEFVIANGLRSAKKTFQYQFTPATAGQFVLPVFIAQVNGQKLRTAPVKVTVKSRNGATPPGGLPASFLKVHPPARTNFYVGEMFGIGVGLYFRNAREPLVPQIRAEGVRYLLDRARQRPPAILRLQGTTYTANLFTNTAVASRPGLLPIFFETDLTVLDYSRNQFGEKRIVHLVSDTATLNIRSLPRAGRPTTFSGAVGEFNLDVTANPTSPLTAGDPLTLKILISGPGALDHVPTPDTSAWNGFKVYSTQRRLQHIDSLGRNAILTITQLIAPLNAGVVAIPPIEFSFFDPKTTKYRTLRSQPITLQVRPGPAALPESTRLPHTAESGPVEAVPSLRDIKRYPGVLFDIAPPLLLRPWFWAAPGTPLLAWLGLLFWRRRKSWLATHQEVIRRRKVARRIRQGLRRMPGLDDAEYYHEAQQLLKEQIGERLDLPARGITSTVVDHELAKRLPSESLDTLRVLFATCDRALFAPENAIAKPESFHHDLQSCLRALRRLPTRA